jgi:hypothetical protein
MVQPPPAATAPLTWPAVHPATAITASEGKAAPASPPDIGGNGANDYGGYHGTGDDDRVLGQDGQ